MTDKDVADEFVALAERVTEHAVPPVKAVDCAIQDDLGFNYGQMESEHLPLDYDRLHAKLVAAMFNGLPTILTALRQPATERADAGGLADAKRLASEGLQAVDEVQRMMDDHYQVIREYLGREQGPGFAHRVNSTLLRIRARFTQITRALKPAEPAAEVDVERQFDRLRSIETALANGAHYADDPECHPCYPGLVGARQTLEKLFTRLQAENARLRKALIEAGREAGAILSDTVSNDFLMLVPGEVKAKIATLGGSDA